MRQFSPQRNVLISENENKKLSSSLLAQGLLLNSPSSDLSQASTAAQRQACTEFPDRRCQILLIERTDHVHIFSLLYVHKSTLVINDHLYIPFTYLLHKKQRNSSKVHGLFSPILGEEKILLQSQKWHVSVCYF